MYGISVSAPGKLFLSGEYAVLEGAEAVVVSVARRVWARPVRKNIPQSQLIRDVKREVGRFLSARSGSNVGQLPNVDIDSTGFSTATHKLGIGSSAAVAASTTGVLFEWAGLPVNEYRESVCDVATRAHRAYQNGKGSGADVATSVYGGTIIFSRSSPVFQSRAEGVRKVFVWTGKPASTISLVEEVKILKERSPEHYALVMNPLVALAAELAEGYRAGDVDRLLLSTDAYENAMSALGDAAGVCIVTPEMKQIAEVARACNGASKPSGAGGGDAVVALFRTDADARDFITRIQGGALEILDFDTHVPGVRREN
jgi:phosphomevalonate kinase